MMKYIYTLLILGLYGLSSCVHDETPVNLSPDINGSDSYLQIHMNLPELMSQQTREVSTKAMNDAAERMIDINKLNVLVFKEVAGTEKYVYKAPLSGSVEYDTQDGTKAMITVKLMKSQPGEKYRMVIVANHEIASSSLVSGTTTKTEALELMVFSTSGKWNARTQNYTPFPMWGESDLVTVSASMPAQSVNLYRALARIDVGINFTTEDGKLSENVTGLSNFKLKEIKIYRTYNQGYVAPLNSSMANYTTPFIPGNANVNADVNPINYKIADNGGVDKYVREIYIPEVNLPAAPENDNMHCLVVGGYYNGSSTETFYRLDFATETNPGDVRTYLPVLRNYRYVFNINKVRGPGFATPELALQSTATIENIGYDLISWDETITNVEVQGKYYFGVDQKPIILSPEANTSSRVVFYQTNLPASETVMFEWQKGDNSPFKLPVHIVSNKKFVVVAKERNTTNTILSDTLFVKAGPFSIPIPVEQNYVNFKYTINCESVQVFGTYLNGKVLNPLEHYIKVTLTPDDASIQGESYEIETVDLEGSHGINFRSTGTLTGSTQTIILRGSGTVSHNSEDGPFKLRIKTNSSSGSYCEATINTVDRKMKILVLGNDVKHGYNIALPNTGSNKVLTSPNNFGPNDNSVVKTEGFELIDAKLDTDYPNYPVNQSKLRNWLLDGNDLVDILYITQNAYIQKTTAAIIAEYLNQNGVVLVFNEGNGGGITGTVANIMNACFGVSNITQLHQNPAGLIYQLSGNPDEPDDPYNGDPILCGPFGDVRGKQWGEDASFAALLYNLPADDIVIYSNGVPLNGSAVPNDRLHAVTGFRHKTKNLVYFGDGGFTSSGTDGTPYIISSNTICPLNWNTETMFPIPHPSYGVNYAQMEVYNSQVWCNVMAWAIGRAASHGINTR